MNTVIQEALQQISKELASGNISPEEMEQIKKSLFYQIHFIEQSQVYQARQALRVA